MKTASGSGLGFGTPLTKRSGSDERPMTFGGARMTDLTGRMHCPHCTIVKNERQKVVGLALILRPALRMGITSRSVNSAAENGSSSSGSRPEVSAPALARAIPVSSLTIPVQGQEPNAVWTVDASKAMTSAARVRGLYSTSIELAKPSIHQSSSRGLPASRRLRSSTRLSACGSVSVPSRDRTSVSQSRYSYVRCTGRTSS